MGRMGFTAGVVAVVGDLDIDRGNCFDLKGQQVLQARPQTLICLF